MTGSALLVLLALLVVIAGALELYLHKKKLSSIRSRIHVNGTRGKSSVTRLIASALREAGIVTCAKTTGTTARMILPDARELPIFRPAGPNVIEQKRIVATAAAQGAEALVIECMALTPELQSLCEFRLIDATHAVITNARPDHLDVMGPHAGDVARALAGMTPRGTKLYTAERQQLEVLRAAALDRKSTLITVDERDVAALTPEEMSRFRYREHPENVALALRVVEDLGITRDVALLGMWKTEPDPGALTRHQVDFFGRTVVFYNGFAANDPISTEKLWALAIEENPDLLTRVAIVNCRADRPDRSLRLGEGFMRLKPPSFVVLMGSGTYVFAQAALRAGLDAGRLVFMENQNVEEIFERVMSLVERSAVIMGMGNTGGHGLDLSRYFSNRALPPGAAS